MKFLINTHSLIWYVGGNKELSKRAVSIIEKPENIIYVSKASLWELAIKISIGRGILVTF
jgi:PIN domain nuclease of toxin-antitoxin system